MTGRSDAPAKAQTKTLQNPNVFVIMEARVPAKTRDLVRLVATVGER